MALTEEATKQAVAVLMVEYSTLRTEILQRIASRFQSLTVPFVVIALVVSILAGQQEPPVWVTVVILIALAALFVASTYAFFRLSRGVGRCSGRLVQIETELNSLLAATYDTGSLLRWESDQQARGWLARLGNGPGV